jgi:ATP-dependent RNA helicase DDX23/PRP28
MAGPLSVDEILARQKAEKEAAAKVSHHPVLCSSKANLQPKFLSKADRAKLALEKRNAEVKEQQEREEAERKERLEFDRKAEEERRRANEGRYGGPGGPGGQGGYGGDARCKFACHRASLSDNRRWI